MYNRHYRGFDMSAPPESRYKKWEDAVLSHPTVKATTSNDDLYLDSYERLVVLLCAIIPGKYGFARYAKNLPSTSQVANAINSGRGLP